MQKEKIYKDVIYMRNDGHYEKGFRWAMDAEVETAHDDMFVFHNKDLVGVAKNFKHLDGVGVCDIKIMDGDALPSNLYPAAFGQILEKEGKEIKKARIMRIKLLDKAEDPRIKSLGE